MYADYRQQALVRAYQSAFTGLQDAAATDDPAAEVAAGAEPQDADTGNIEALGVLTIPKIDLSVVIGQGVDDGTLRYAVGHFDGTALPGTAGNCCVAGHRNYTWGKFFNRLNEVTVGDELLS